MHGTISNQARDAAQARALPRSEKFFANETAEQRCKHHEIDWRYRQQRKRRHHPKVYVRIRELERAFADRYGPELPDDDAGRDDIFVMANHLAHLNAPDKRIRAWVRRWAPWHDDARTEALIAKVLSKPLKWTADALAKRIGLDDDTRTRLRITTIGAIDCGKAKREARRRKRKNAARRASRLKAGAAPHAKSARRTKPWEARGISRATYYRHRRIETSETSETNSRTPCRNGISVTDATVSQRSAGGRCAPTIEPWSIRLSGVPEPLRARMLSLTALLRSNRAAFMTRRIEWKAAPKAAAPDQCWSAP
jgi:hypothetical protein